MPRAQHPIRISLILAAATALGPALPAIAAEDAAPPAPPAVIDQIVLVIGDRVVTNSELRIEEELRARVPWWAPPQPPGTSTLQVLADAALIRTLAGEAALYVPTDELVRERAEQAQEAWGDPEAWAAFLTRSGLDEERLGALIRSRLIVERYLQRTLSLAARSEGKTLEELYASWIPTQRGRLPVRYPAPIEPTP